MRSINPSAFALRAIAQPELRIPLATAVSSLRPSTLTQQATLELLQHTAQEWLSHPA